MVAEYFASYFSTIANERNLTEADFDKIKLISDRWIPTSLISERSNIVKSYRRYETSMLSKSSGYDLIPPEVLKIAAEELVSSITYLSLINL